MCDNADVLIGWMLLNCRAFLNEVSISAKTMAQMEKTPFPQKKNGRTRGREVRGEKREIMNKRKKKKRNTERKTDVGAMEYEC